MKGALQLPQSLGRHLSDRTPCLWVNDRYRSVRERRWRRFAGLLETLFPELQRSGGIIESELHPAQQLQGALAGHPGAGQWWIKGDHALPVAGSIKALRPIAFPGQTAISALS